mgnify:CR=1 FL=1
MTTKISILQRSLLSAIALLVCNFAIGQTLVSGQLNSGRIPTPTMLFMNVTPDARSAAMGDAGVALSVDANAIHWNTAKLATTDKKMGFSMSYTPWLRNLVNSSWSLLLMLRPLSYPLRTLIRSSCVGLLRSLIKSCSVLTITSQIYCSSIINCFNIILLLRL